MNFERILILDGGLGTKIQQYGLTENQYRTARFANHPHVLGGNHDVLTLTHPEIIAEIHREYIDAGADIIETCSFNANAISQAEYGMQEYVAEMCSASARIARKAADSAKRPCYVAGSVGPTKVSLSLASDVDHPEFRAVDFDTMVRVYEEQIDALVSGGVDLILIETIFDALNAKAALYAASCIKERRNKDIPVMLSASLADQAGRLLSGQAIEAFIDTVIAFNPMSVGLNCGEGVGEMERFLPVLNERLPHNIAISCYPNAGLPDEQGCYPDSPQKMADKFVEFAQRGWLNIAGGCCGTTPDHIRAMAQSLAGIPARKLTAQNEYSCGFCGLNTVSEQSGERLIVAERANVTGSRKFKRLIEQKNWDEALEVAGTQMNGDAHLMDICMDDAMLDAPAVMREFLRRLAAEPEISKYPVCLDSSCFDVIRTGLRECQGRCLVNSISLKGGEVEFLERAREIRKFGAVAVVMAFDEQGQASTTERRITILTRAVNLLIERLGFHPCDIAVDPNILAIGTGIEEHNDQAMSFIEACRIMRRRFPGIRTIGGLSNLSFSFRGRDDVRTAIHQAFLKRAGEDLTMVIANPSVLHAPVDSELAGLADDLVGNVHPGALDKLLRWMDEHQPENKAVSPKKDDLQSMGTIERIANAFVGGNPKYLQSDITELSRTMTPLAIVEGPLMSAMNEVGERFGRGEMFLPQIVRAARLMKHAIGYLNLEQNALDSAIVRKKVLIATVWGDVHDIGKNIVSIVLSCNGYEVIDLGVMVETERIVAEAKRLRVDAIGLSGLISPSLNVMVEVAKALNHAGVHVPLIVGGAAANDEHTALCLAPAYAPGTVCYVADASRVPGVLGPWLSDDRRSETIARIEEHHRIIAGRRQSAHIELRSLEESRKLAPALEFHSEWMKKLDAEVSKGLQAFEWKPSELAEHISWPYVMRVLKGKSHAADGMDDGIIQKCLKIIQAADGIPECLRTRGHLIFMHARRAGDDIELLDDSGHTIAVLYGVRAQQKNLEPLALADFVAPENGAVGLFALTTSVNNAEKLKIPEITSDEILLYTQVIATSLVDIANDVMHRRVAAPINHYICPAPGYPIAPDHALKRDILNLTKAAEIGISLTDSMMMQPLASVCGYTIVHPKAHYFSMGEIDNNQRTEYYKRSGNPL